MKSLKSTHLIKKRQSAVPTKMHTLKITLTRLLEFQTKHLYCSFYINLPSKVKLHPTKRRSRKLQRSNILD